MAHSTIIRENTLKFSFDRTYLRPSPFEIHEWLYEELHLEDAKVFGIQLDSFQNSVFVKLTSGQYCEEILSTTSGKTRFKHSDGAISEVLVTNAGLGIRTVRVMNIALETSREAIALALKPFGNILDVKMDMWGAKMRYKKANGVRNVKIELSRHIPSYVAIANQKALVIYEGQPRTCAACNSAEHVRADCPSRRTTVFPVKYVRPQEGLSVSQRPIPESNSGFSAANDLSSQKPITESATSDKGHNTKETHPNHAPQPVTSKSLVDSAASESTLSQVLSRHPSEKEVTSSISTESDNLPHTLMECEEAEVETAIPTAHTLLTSDANTSEKAATAASEQEATAPTEHDTAPHEHDPAPYEQTPHAAKPISESTTLVDVSRGSDLDTVAFSAPEMEFDFELPPKADKEDTANMTPADTHDSDSDGGDSYSIHNGKRRRARPNAEAMAAQLKEKLHKIKKSSSQRPPRKINKQASPGLDQGKEDIIPDVGAEQDEPMGQSPAAASIANAATKMPRRAEDVEAVDDESLIISTNSRTVPGNKSNSLSRKKLL